MDAQTVGQIAQLGVDAATPNTIEINGLQYSDKDVKLVMPPMAECTEVHTLSGLADLIQAKVEALMPDSVVVVVWSPGRVTCWSKVSDEWGRSMCYAEAVLPPVTEFAFGQFMPAEEFLVGLLSKFVQTDDRDYVARMASNMTAEAVTVGGDDGVTQSVATRTGVVLAEKTAVRNMVLLAPYRTFREVEQPVSRFLFRVRPSQKQGEAPWCALFEADGGAWRLEAMLNIKRKLDDRNLGVTVVA